MPQLQHGLENGLGSPAKIDDMRCLNSRSRLFPRNRQTTTPALNHSGAGQFPHSCTHAHHSHGNDHRWGGRRDHENRAKRSRHDQHPTSPHGYRACSAKHLADCRRRIGKPDHLSYKNQQHLVVKNAFQTQNASKHSNRFQSHGNDACSNQIPRER
ncbi:hypothetical protein FF011L_22020 [Roseimaritima multifibrata]|uniref:Uncharacterized protein n=1 Tax=Roseimaritima multifibrata TaxID=1930274 RepID=A0A517MEX3_9BACT|nr:hypothetical protein FF011L_22020 [Roseimaritima multifibrata]